ncbi:hypothetical protein GDO86_010150, partial [Hymenochirus boettgeri]
LTLLDLLFKYRIKSKEADELQTRLHRMQYHKDSNNVRLSKELKEKEDSLAHFQEKSRQLGEQLADKGRAEETSRRKIQHLESELETVKEVLKQSQEEIVILQHERELNIVSYQNRIEELQDALTQRIVNEDSWDTKLQAELEQERNMYLRKLEELQQKWKEDADMEFKIEKQKNEELIRKLQKQQEELKEKASEQLNVEINILEKKLLETQTMLKEKNRGKESEIVNLKKIISELELTIKREQSNSCSSLEKTRKEISAKSEKLKELTHNLEEQRLHLDQAIQENSFLKETVRLECEERYELTEALTQAREQLLELKRVGGNLSSSQRPFHSDKPVFSGASNSPSQTHILGASFSKPAKQTSFVGSYATGSTSRQSRNRQNSNISLPLLPPPQKDRASSVTDVRQTITAVLRRNSSQP